MNARSTSLLPLSPYTQRSHVLLIFINVLRLIKWRRVSSSSRRLRRTSNHANGQSARYDATSAGIYSREGTIFECTSNVLIVMQTKLVIMCAGKVAVNFSLEKETEGGTKTSVGFVKTISP
jgi:hypothetical protein